MRILKGALVFLAGAGVGFAGSYIYYKKKLDEKYEEVNELKEHYFGKIEKVKEKEEYETKLKELNYISDDKDVVTDMIDRVEKTALEKSSPPEDIPDGPYIISEPEFSETELGFEKLEMDYYLDDGSLVYDADEDNPLQNVEDIMGYDALDIFIDDDSLDCIYIRNRKFATDYLIHKVSGKYSEIIGLGGDDDE